MDTVKFEIALARYPPRSSATPSPAPSATVPSLTKESPGTPTLQEDVKVPATTKNISGNGRAVVPEGKQSLGDRFHDWMEMDLEHGL
ncbi:hypothetical protein PSACC_02127 [Paramicrosporidium saccamoebae]|uniref:Uncharacterized protein n=1 Tax=Paramicrosporidium saccamoebae TaxID=1246581 RepID=A0A2H9TK76_9FUNG|nr:hypothetical protein PSACC_02127 [Paramicrosporidium saccamoebae]